jgi:hypothetical protein
LTSASAKARGLAGAIDPKISMGYWAPEDPPKEKNHLDLLALISKKARDLTRHGVTQLERRYYIRDVNIPDRFLICDVHPSLSRPGDRGMKHLVKPPEGLSMRGLINFVSGPWAEYGGDPVTAQLAAAYAMTDRWARLYTNAPMQDSVFITYSQNPLGSRRAVEEYLKYLKRERFDGYDERDFVNEVSGVAGGVMQEYLYAWAAGEGNVGVIERALSCDRRSKPRVSDIIAIGAGGLTGALVGWIETQARRKVPTRM